MNDENQDYLDKQQLIADSLQPTSWKKRLGAYVIDIVFFYLLLFTFYIMLSILSDDVSRFIDWLSEHSIADKLFTLLMIIVYFSTCEIFGGRTLGKKIVGTRIVHESGKKPNLLNIIGRNLARAIPLDILSFLGQSKPRGWHDKASDTMVVDDSFLFQDHDNKNENNSENY
jgi:uncharacterized RDD family membrane protein YckC